MHGGPFSDMTQQSMNVPTRLAKNATADAASLWLVISLLGAALLWSYWPTLLELWAVWQSNDDYSVGQLVPFVTAYVIWSRRKELKRGAGHRSWWWWGLAALVTAQFVRFVGIYYNYVSLERYSMVLSVWSLFLILLPAAAIRGVRLPLVFLLLMVPLPGRVHDAVTLPLQEFATRSAMFVLQLFGFWVRREGNVIQLNDETLVAVAEACNGLRMLTAFVVVAAALAMLVNRPVWQKAIVTLSSVPVAIIANTVRLVATVLLIHLMGSTAADTFFHDFAGLVMMPVAIIILLGELALLRWLVKDGDRSAGTAPRPKGVAQRPVRA